MSSGFVVPKFFPASEFQRRLDVAYRYKHWGTRYEHGLRINAFNGIGVPLGGRVLDVGCGCGAYTMLMAARGCQVISLDLDLPALITAQAWARGKDPHRSPSKPVFIMGDAQQLPFPDGSFDGVVCSEVIEHLDSPTAGIEEIARVLKPGGAMVLSVPNLVSLKFLPRGVHHFLSCMKHKRRLPADGHLQFPFWRIIHLCKEAGFHIKGVTGVCLIPPHLPPVARLVFKHANLASIWLDLETVLLRIFPFKYFGCFVFVRSFKIEKGS